MQQTGTSFDKSKVLIFLFGSLGDTIVAIPALRAVRRQFPDSELLLLHDVQSGNIVKASQVIPDDLIDGYLSYDSYSGKIKKIFGLLNLGLRLRRRQIEAVVYLVISERPKRSVQRDKLFFQMSGARRLIGFHSFSGEELYPIDEQNRPAMTENEAVRKLNRLKLDGIEISPEDLRQPLLSFSTKEIENIKSWLSQRRKKPESRLVAIAPGCKTIANTWSLENFIRLGRKMIESENCELLVVGGKAEFDLGERMISSWGEGINAAGEFSVRDSGALLSVCDFYVGLDTGTTHLAAASGTRCLGIYGERNNPGHWYPLGDEHLIVFHPVKCAGCRLPVCPKQEHPCMKGITVESVWKHLQEFMQNGKQNGKTQAVKSIAV